MKTITIVNNEEPIAELVRYHLEREGYRVRVFLNGVDALAGLIDDPCDLVMLDSFNPPLGGVGLFRKLRKHTAVPVIFLTPHAEDIAKELRGTNFEAADYIRCPFSMVDMVTRVKAAVDGRAGANVMAAESKVTLPDAYPVVRLLLRLGSNFDDIAGLGFYAGKRRLTGAALKAWHEAEREQRVPPTEVVGKAKKRERRK